MDEKYTGMGTNHFCENFDVIPIFKDYDRYGLSMMPKDIIKKGESSLQLNYKTL